MMALMLRYVEDNEEVAHQYARALVSALATTDDLQVSGALCLARDIVTESTNDIRNFEGEDAASRIDAALRRLIDRVDAELADWAALGEKDMKMSTTIYRAEDPTLKTIEYGTVYYVRVPGTGEPWTLHKIADECGADSVEPLEVPAGWDDAYEYAMGDPRIWPRIHRLAHDAFLANANLEIALVPVVDEGADPGSRALLYRFTWPY